MDVGDKFPHFILKDENGDTLDSNDLLGLRYVLYIYPKDMTSGCTQEANDFNALFPKFMLRNIPVFGLSKDTPVTHKKFKDKYSLKFKLLSDPEHDTLKAADAWGKKMMYGKEVEATIRSTYIIGKDGVVEAAWTKVKVPGHADAVLEKAVLLTKDQ